MRCYIFIFGILLGLSFPMKSIAQQIDFRCTQVNATGDVILNWLPTSIPANYQYEIYRSVSKTGAYTQLSIITNLAITTYTDIGANGGLQQWFYTIKAVPQPPDIGTEYDSDTIGNIAFVLNNPSIGVANLYWTHPSTPPLATQAQTFDIYKERTSVWSLWDTCHLLQYDDTIHVCGETLGYEIRLYDSIGCESISIIHSESFTDFISPSTPLLDSVSINPVTGKTEMGWNPASDPDIVGYIIYVLRNGIWEVADTVLGVNSTYYLDNNNDASKGIQHYRIAAIDTCRNSSPMGDAHNTLLLNASINKCDSLVFLSWNAYNNMPDSLTGYRIWVSQNGGSFVLLDTVGSGLQSYTHRGADPMSTYTYYIQAYNLKNGYSSSSSKKDVIFNYVASSGNVWMRYVSVVDNAHLEIAVFVPDTVAWNNILLFKAEKDGLFSQIESNSKVMGQEDYIFTDYNVNVHHNTYYYFVSITDECDYIFISSDTANNIVLQEKGTSSNDDIAIEWKPYNGFGTRLDSYDIFRRTQIETSFQCIDNVPSSLLDYSENVWGSASQGGKFYYQVCANEDNSNIYGFQDKSYSNIIELIKEPISYIPNLFSPNSNIPENRVFKPVHSYVDAEEYIFCIYDRWGSMMFQTTDITAGWDGSTNGQTAMAGVYSYYITYRIDEKNTFKKQGIVTLIR